MAQLSQVRRLQIIMAGSLVFVLLISIRLIYVQGLDSNVYRDRANLELSNVSTLLAPRGNITDINGVQLAVSIPAETVIIDQTQIADPEMAAKITAPILKIPVADLEKMYIGKLRYRIISKNITPARWKSLQDAISDYNKSLGTSIKGFAKRINGFYSERKYIRSYPLGKATSSIIGFINHNSDGASGMEASLNSLLKGVDGKYSFENGAGTIIPGSQQIITERKPGASIQLTINSDVQYVAQSAISKAVTDAKATSGTVIVMDPKTGAILAEASAPTFDPNKPKSITLDNIRNPAVQDVFEPGSTGKVITIATALETKAINPNTLFTIPPTYRIDGNTYHDAEEHGVEYLTTSGILAVSSNIGVIKIGNKIPHQTFYDYLVKFGIGTNTISRLPGESAGILPKVEDWSRSTAHNFAFGQGYASTALQNTSVFSTIANDGVRVNPTVLAGIYDSSGNYTPNPAQERVQAISAKTAMQVRQMLEGVVSANGTAPAAAIPGYRVAGKTGTAQRVDPSCHCYRGYTSSFIGFAPADKPKYVVGVVIQNPKGVYYGGLIAAPVFKTVMSFVLNSQHVLPTGGKPKELPLNSKQLIKFKNKVKMLNSKNNKEKIRAAEVREKQGTN